MFRFIFLLSSIFARVPKRTVQILESAVFFFWALSSLIDIRMIIRLFPSMTIVACMAMGTPSIKKERKFTLRLYNWSHCWICPKKDNPYYCTKAFHLSTGVDESLRDYARRHNVTDYVQTWRGTTLSWTYIGRNHRQNPFHGVFRFLFPPHCGRNYRKRRIRIPPHFQSWNSI